MVVIVFAHNDELFTTVVWLEANFDIFLTGRVYLSLELPSTTHSFGVKLINVFNTRRLWWFLASDFHSGRLLVNH